MSQTAYGLDLDRALPGMAGGSNLGAVNLSLAFEGTGTLAFGLAVVVGTDPETQCDLPSTASELFRGVSAHRHALQDETLAGYAQDETADIVSRGLVWAVAEEAMAVGDAVHFVHTGGNEGQFRNDVAGGNADLVAGVSVEAYDAGTGLVLLNINLP